MTPINIRGMLLYKSLLDVEAQTALVEEVRALAKAAPLFTPITSRGQKMSVRMSSAGQFGWVSDRKGYRYEAQHPQGADWPQIPDRIMEIWQDVAPKARAPESCLINYYDETAKMGMHQDRDEADFDQPVVSISLGDDALFRVGNDTKGGKTESVWLSSGDVIVMGGPSRLLYHGIDRIKAGSSTLLKSGGRINLTLRVVT